jgi:transposase
MIHYVGLDCHRNTIRACHRNQQGKILAECDLPATHQALVDYARVELTKEDHVVLEATFHSHAIARILQPYVAKVIVSNPLQTKAIAQSKKKTDKVDARVLSDLLRLDYLPTVWLPNETTQQMRDLCSSRVALVNDRVRIKNRIHSVLASALIPLPVTDIFGKKGQEWLEKLELTTRQRSDIVTQQRLLTLVTEEIEKLETEMAVVAWKDPRVKLLMTLPGVNVTVAVALLAAIGDISRFPTPEQLCGYLGLVPSIHQSGSHCYLGPITRQGNSKARWLLIQAAQHLGSHPGPLGVFFRRLLKKKNRNVAVVAGARKLLTIAWHMLKNNEPYRYAQPEPTQTKLAALRVKVTQQKRVGGTKKGEPRSENYGKGPGLRRTPSLPTVYAQEELPAAKSPEQLPSAERWALREQGVAGYVADIQKVSTRVRKSAKSTPTQEVTQQGSQQDALAVPAEAERSWQNAPAPCHKVTQRPLKEGADHAPQALL